MDLKPQWLMATLLTVSLTMPAVSQDYHPGMGSEETPPIIEDVHLNPYLDPIKGSAISEFEHALVRVEAVLSANPHNATMQNLLDGLYITFYNGFLTENGDIAVFCALDPDTGQPEDQNCIPENMAGFDPRIYPLSLSADLPPFLEEALNPIVTKMRAVFNKTANEFEVQCPDHAPVNSACFQFDMDGDRALRVIIPPMPA
jgi:hypothetical protein